MRTPPAVAEIVLVPAAVERKVKVATPLPLLLALVGAKLFPLPVAEGTTLTPERGSPAPFRTVTVTVALPDVVIDVGDAESVERDALGPLGAISSDALVTLVNPGDANSSV
jgi:hypothetical protein